MMIAKINARLSQQQSFWKMLLISKEPNTYTFRNTDERMIEVIGIKYNNTYCIYVNKGINELVATNKTWHIKILPQTKISNISLDTRKMQKSFCCNFKTWYDSYNRKLSRELK